MKIEDINAVELAAATGHVAAGQFFAILNDGKCWISPEIDNQDSEAVQKAAMVLGEYACARELVPGQLMSYAGIERILEIDDDLDLHRSRAWAYDLFTVTARHAHMLATAEQKKIAEDKAFEERQAAIVPLKLEDSIFEPHGSLGDMEDYQKEFLANSEREQQRLLEEQQEAALAAVRTTLAAGGGFAPIIAAAELAEATVPAMTLGQTIPTTNDSEDAHETETADPGSETGGAPAPAGEASDALRAPGDAGQAEAGSQGVPAGDIPPAGEAGQTAPLPGDDAAGVVTDDGKGDSGSEAPAEPAAQARGGKKPAKGKSAD